MISSYELAEELAVLDNFPKSNKAVGVVAELIAGLCKTDEQAAWLRKELLSGKYTKWGGPGWLKDIFTQRYTVTEERHDTKHETHDCPYCFGTDWRVSRKVGLYEGVERCDHRGIATKPLPAERPCRVCNGQGTVQDATGVYKYCLCTAGQVLRENPAEGKPDWCEFMNGLHQKSIRSHRAGRKDAQATKELETPARKPLKQLEAELAEAADKGVA